MAAQLENLTRTAAALGVHVMTVRRWRANPAVGFPPAVVINGRPYMDVKEVAEWINSRKEKVEQAA